MRINSTSKPLAVAVLVLAAAFAPDCRAQEKPEVTVSASATKIDAAGKQTITVTFVMEKDWHIYANPVKSKAQEGVETKVEVKAKVKLADVKIVYPAGKLNVDKSQNKSMVYVGKASIQIIVQRSAGDTSPLEVEYSFIACNDVLETCLLPKKDKITVP